MLQYAIHTREPTWLYVTTCASIRAFIMTVPKQMATYRLSLLGNWQCLNYVLTAHGLFMSSRHFSCLLCMVNGHWSRQGLLPRDCPWFTSVAKGLSVVKFVVRCHMPVRGLYPLSRACLGLSSLSIPLPGACPWFINIQCQGPVWGKVCCQFCCHVPVHDLLELSRACPRLTPFLSLPHSPWPSTILSSCYCSMNVLTVMVTFVSSCKGCSHRYLE